jgi:transcriptional regulator GlxA family with amidase domain
VIHTGMRPDPRFEPRGASFVQTPANTNVQQLGHLLVAELQPIIDAICISLSERQIAGDLDVTMTVPVARGQTLVVSLLTGSQSFQAQPKPSSRGLDARQLGRVNETIHEKIGEPIPVSMLSSVAGLSRSYFSHAFRTSVGRTPHEHIVRMRIEHAMKLMTGSDVPLSEIALAAGFSDQAHFSNKFRRTIGKTPGEWRRAISHDRPQR